MKPDNIFKQYFDIVYNTLLMDDSLTFWDKLSPKYHKIKRTYKVVVDEFHDLIRHTLITVDIIQSLADIMERFNNITSYGTSCIRNHIDQASGLGTMELIPGLPKSPFVQKIVLTIDNNFPDINDLYIYMDTYYYDGSRYGYREKEEYIKEDDYAEAKESADLIRFLILDYVDFMEDYVKIYRVTVQ